MAQFGAGFGERASRYRLRVARRVLLKENPAEAGRSLGGTPVRGMTGLRESRTSDYEYWSLSDTSMTRPPAIAHFIHAAPRAIITT
jgi:hypothetical protein